MKAPSYAFLAVVSLLSGNASAAVPSTNCLPVREGLVSWWRAEGGAEDSFGTNHGTALDGAGFATGRIGHAFSFDGVDDRIAVPDAQSLQLTPSLSIEGWINIRGWPSPQNSFGAGMIVFRGDDRPGLDPFYVVVLNTGVIRFSINAPDGRSAFIDAEVVTNRWTHFAATIDDSSGAMKLYLNATLVALTTTSVRPIGDLASASSGLGIGNAQQGSGLRFAFDGLIDELKLYSRALTSEEVQLLYTSRACPEPTLDIQCIAFVTVNAPSGENVRVDFRDALVPGSLWQPLTNFVMPDAPLSFLDTDGTNSVRRIYRAVLRP
ncbi:MAG: LamG domain-containing protein [Verrucomicrobia subdivision 3 bacterium]|nr:LamG domain-containing protein [Limisphaerales bacterium]